MSWKEECGVFGIWNDEEASKLTYLGLYALQHRGQESAGIVSLKNSGDGGQHFIHKGLGLVNDVFDQKILDSLSGNVAIGHVRYSTAGGNHIKNAQPLTAQLRQSPVAIAHNGNIVNAHTIKNELMMSGAIFQGSNDTEVLLHLLARRNNLKFMEALKESVEVLEGAFSLLFLTRKKLIAVRDRFGFRPLVLGRKKKPCGGVATVIASETCAFDLIGAQFEREIEPGEIFWIDAQGEHSIKMNMQNNEIKAQCIFEHVYFSRPDSVVFGKNVYSVRKNFGKILAKQNKIQADIVVPVPDSGVPAALGFSEESKIPFDFGIIRNHYVGRTFIEPKQSIRSFGVKVKLNTQTEILKNKKVIVVDDSLVRGTTSKKIIQLIRQAGAKEVHLKIAAPPTVSPCYYGVDTPQESELIANMMSVEQIKNFIGADSLDYLPESGLYEAVDGSPKSFCTACFTKKYPTSI